MAAGMLSRGPTVGASLLERVFLARLKTSRSTGVFLSAASVLSALSTYAYG